MSTAQPPLIGKNILTERKTRKMSLDELARRSGVSKSMLSQIEQDKTNPTLMTAWKIAKALEMTIEELMEAEGDTMIEVIRCDDAPVIFSDDKLCEIRIDSPMHMTDSLELYQMIFAEGGKLISDPHFAKAEEFLTVIEGTLQVTSGDSSSVLQKGDTARYKADVHHAIENMSEGSSEAYVVVRYPK
jgi:transcriptional regulator with XRE-family HTH domain